MSDDIAAGLMNSFARSLGYERSSLVSCGSCKLNDETMFIDTSLYMVAFAHSGWWCHDEIPSHLTYVSGVEIIVKDWCDAVKTVHDILDKGSTVTIDSIAVSSKMEAGVKFMIEHDMLCLEK